MNKFDLWFCLVKLSYKLKIKLIKHFKCTENIWYYSLSEEETLIFEKKEEIKLKKALRAAWNVEQIQFLLKKIDKEQIEVVILTDALYPKALAQYEDIPFAIFYKGNIEKLNQKYNVGIVGSRKCTNYGVDITNIVVRALCENEINTISGLARGIDTVTHKSTIENEGFTCGVLGCGIDILYPKENKSLYDAIIKKGCIVSEFLPGTEPYAYNFPIRNRTISALSNLIFIVEAGAKSGSLITATAALEQGKDVIAVPGSIFCEQSKGTNQLIKEGAYSFTELKDLFQLMNLERIEKSSVKTVETNISNKNIVEMIGSSPIHIDDIIRRSNIDIKQLYKVLFEMQLRDEIICLAGNYYARIMKTI